MTEPLIDVIIPVYNGAAFIGAAISSIQRQTFKELKIIIVDDGSEDDTTTIIEALAADDNRIFLIRQKHMGVQFALNTALNEAKAEYIAFLDADDLWHPRKLEKQLEQIIARDAEFCFCLIQEFDDKKTTAEIAKHTARIAPMKGYHKSACLARREVFNKYGMFSVGIGDFVEWFSRAIRNQTSFEIIDEVLAYRRIHDTNTMLGADKNMFLQILKKHLDESRKAKKP